jgi:Ca2+ transporting ATPase
VRDLVVGDIVELNQGDRVPADCLILDEMNMVVD